MADKKISALTSASTPLAGTEVLPIVQSGATVKVAVSDLTAGRAVAATALTMSTGSLVPSTAGQGVNFTANTAAAGMTSQLLNWYEEGTWTPAFTFSTPGDLAVTYTTQVGFYTRTGSLVTAFFRCVASALTYTTASGNFIISGLPFTSNATTAWYGVGPIIVSGVNLTAFAATTKYANTRLAPNTTLINILLSGDSQASAYAASASNIVSGGSPNNPNLTGSVTYRI